MSNLKISKEHFPSVEAKIETAKLGLWVFLATEILLFSVLFACFAVYKNMYKESFDFCQTFLDVNLGTLNTIVLLFSSLTAVLSINELKNNNSSKSLFYLFITILCGLTFFICKIF